MQNLPIGIQTFSDIIQNNYLYVDKTRELFDLVKDPKGVYFLSRPRRFGKSLLISTLNEIFEGNKKLFKGLWIHNSDYAWKKHPVVRIDFSKKKAENKEDLKEFILNQLKNIADEYGVILERDQYDEAFDELLSKLSQINKVAVLIDEYDKPIIDNIKNPELAVELREAFVYNGRVLKQTLQGLKLSNTDKLKPRGKFDHLDNFLGLKVKKDRGYFICNCLFDVEFYQFQLYFPIHQIRFCNLQFCDGMQVQSLLIFSY